MSRRRVTPSSGSGDRRSTGVPLTPADLGHHPMATLYLDSVRYQLYPPDFKTWLARQEATGKSTLQAIIDADPYCRAPLRVRCTGTPLSQIKPRRSYRRRRQPV